LDAIYGLLALLFLLALGWLISKSKVLTAIVNGIGVASNILWGTLFVVGGVWGLFGGYGIWIPLLSIGVGIYFFTTSRFDAKVSAAVDGAVEAVADLAAEKLSGGKEDPAAAPETTPASDPSGEEPPPTTKLLAPLNVLLVIAVVGIAYGLWGLRDAGEVTMTVYGNGTIDTETSYGSPLAWIALLGGGAAAALWQAFRRRVQNGQTVVVPSLDGALAAASRIDAKTKRRLGITLAAVALVVVGVIATNAARSAWNYRLEGQYAQREAEGIAQAEAEAASNNEALSGEYVESESDAGEELTPNGNTHWMQSVDLLSGAPQDGSVQFATVTWTGAGGDSGSFLFAVDDISLGGSDPTRIWDVQLFEGELGSCYVDGVPVSEQEFFEFLGDPTASEGLGSIEFTRDQILSTHAYSDGSQTADSPNDGQASHNGETLFLVIAASEKSQAAADTKLSAVEGAAGDAGAYYYVDQSDHYDGLAQGLWVVCAAFESKSRAEEEVEWMAPRGFSPYVKQATKRCEDLLMMNGLY